MQVTHKTRPNAQASKKKNEENEFNDEEARGRSENALPVPVLKLPLPAPSWTSLRLCGDRCNTGQGPQPRGPRASAQHHHPAAAHPADQLSKLPTHQATPPAGPAPPRSQWKVLAGGLPQADIARREGKHMAKRK